MLFPSLSEVKHLAETYKSIPVFYEVLADSCSPVQIMSAVADLSENSYAGKRREFRAVGALLLYWYLP